MTEKLQKAIKLDIAKKYIEAADLYEEVIKTTNAPLEAYLNLACLYWDAIDPGVTAYYRHPNSFFRRAGNRMYEVLTEAKNKFGDVPEITFWKHYFDFTIMCESHFPELALELAQEGDSLVPYFHVNSYDKQTYAPQIKQLIALCKQQPTAKNRYILAIADR